MPSTWQEMPCLPGRDWQRSMANQAQCKQGQQRLSSTWYDSLFEDRSARAFTRGDVWRCVSMAVQVKLSGGVESEERRNTYKESLAKCYIANGRPADGSSCSGTSLSRVTAG